jgi:glycosyltransferase involved in cell wall biosynthesis
LLEIKCIFEFALKGMMEKADMKEFPLVSIVLPVYNDEDTVEACVRTLIEQDYPKKDIVIADDSSTDRTPEILAKLAKKHQNIKIVRIAHSGVTKARNFGIRISRGKIIFYAEGDAIYNKDYVSKAVKELMKDQKMGGVCVTGGLWTVKETIVSKFIDVENRIKRKMLELGKRKPYYAWIFRKEALEEVGGFDEKLFQGEDKDIFMRVKRTGYSIGLVTGVNWRHKRDQDFWNYLKRAYGGGKSRILFLLKHRRIGEFLRNVALLWFSLACLIVAPFNYWALWLLTFLLVSYLLIKLGLLIHRGWDCVPRKKYLFLLPFFSLSRYVAMGLGLTHGFLILLERKIRGLPTDWSSLHKGS